MALVISCGDDSSDKSPVQAAEESSSSEFERSSSSIQNVTPVSSEAIRSSSSICEDCDESSSSVTPQSSSSETSVSSSSAKSSSSSAKVEDSSSSAKVDESSSSMKAAESSSSVKVEESSSSEKNEVSSSSEKPVESSSSEKVEESSSSEKPVESSSSAMSIYDAENNSLTDLRDNQVYKTVMIGEQIWMAENLNYMPEDTAGTIYSGGTVCGDDNEDLNSDSEMCSDYGRLYLRKVALHKNNANAPNHQGICPDGWVIPQKTDWEKLVSFLGEDSAESLRKKDANWSNKATNESDFSSLKTCVYSTILKKYLNCDAAYYFYWNINSKPYFFRIYDKPSEAINYAYGTTEFMLSVRCIKD